MHKQNQQCRKVSVTISLPMLGTAVGFHFSDFRASLVTQLVKIPPAIQETPFDSWVSQIRWRRDPLPTPISWPEEFHGLYSPWSHKESDMTEQLSLSVTWLMGVPSASRVQS